MWYETLILRILNMSLTGSLVIGILVACRPLLVKAPRLLPYALWAVALFRLLCPMSVSSQISLLGLFDVPTTRETSPLQSSTIEYIPEDLVSNPFPEVDFLADFASDAVNHSLPQGMAQLESRPLAGSIQTATCVWMAGICVMALYSLFSLVRLRRVLRKSEPLRENIRLSHRLDSPIVTGLFRPTIYLPSALSDEEQGHVLLHERHHIRRLDHVTRLLAFTALTIHWFNPLVWLAFYLSDRDMEMSCDEAVVRSMDQNRRCDYSASLLRLAAGRRVRPVSPLSFCEGNPAGRIKNILRWHRPSRLTRMVCVCAGLLLCLSLVTDPVITTGTALYPAVHGRISFELPDDYDYFLPEAPRQGDGNPDVIIYRKGSAYPVCFGCISLNFSRSLYAHSSKPVDTFSGGLSATSYRYRDLVGMNRQSLQVPGLGSLMIRTYNEEFWTDEDYELYDRLVGSITVTTHAEPIYCNLDTDSSLSATADTISDYILYTESRSVCVYLPDARGPVSLTLYEAFTDKPVQTFSTQDSENRNHWVFSGLSIRKVYYLRLTSGDNCSVTIFRKEV